MSVHITDEARWHSWEATPEPTVGEPDGQTVLEGAGDSWYLWHTHNADSTLRYDGELMEARR